MIVQVLKAAKIPILYHCTFSSDLALVPEARHEQAQSLEAQPAPVVQLVQQAPATAFDPSLPQLKGIQMQEVGLPGMPSRLVSS